VNPPPPLAGVERRDDADHLNLLSIFHFIGAGLAILAILFLMVHYAFFNSVMSDANMRKEMLSQGQNAPPPQLFEVFGMFKWFYVIFGIWFAASFVLNLISGFYLRARKHRFFSLVVAAIDCFHFPLGTALGVFTIVVLLRDSVRVLYGD
jgi:hypothetical protein